MSASAHCAACGAEATATCNHCDNEYCADHITREAHNCMGEFGSESTQMVETSSTEQVETQSSRDKTGGEDTRVVVEQKSDNTRFIVGAVILVIGFFISLTGVGAIFGIPMGFLGFGIMFPRFTAVAVILAVLSLLWLLSQF